jgi:hypothetical protein
LRGGAQSSEFSVLMNAEESREYYREENQSDSTHPNGGCIWLSP